jgi:hypothetical protein
MNKSTRKAIGKSVPTRLRGTSEKKFLRKETSRKIRHADKRLLRLATITNDDNDYADIVPMYSVGPWG